MLICLLQVCNRGDDILEAKQKVVAAKRKLNIAKEAAATPHDLLQLALSEQQLGRYDAVLQALGPLHVTAAGELSRQVTPISGA